MTKNREIEVVNENVITTNLVKPESFDLDESQVKNIQDAFYPQILKKEALRKSYLEILNKDITRDVSSEAGELRKQLMRVRTGNKKLHQKNKAFVLAYGRFIDAYKNQEENEIALMEDDLSKIENHFINLELEKIKKITEERKSKLAPYLEERFFPHTLDVMEEEVFEAFLEKTIRDKDLEEKLKKEAAELAEKERKEARRIEQERIKKEIEEEAKKKEISRRQNLMSQLGWTYVIGKEEVVFNGEERVKNEIKLPATKNIFSTSNEAFENFYEHVLAEKNRILNEIQEEKEIESKKLEQEKKERELAEKKRQQEEDEKQARLDESIFSNRKTALINIGCSSSDDPRIIYYKDLVEVEGEELIDMDEVEFNSFLKESSSLIEEDKKEELKKKEEEKQQALLSRSDSEKSQELLSDLKTIYKKNYQFESDAYKAAFENVKELLKQSAQVIKTI